MSNHQNLPPTRREFLKSTAQFAAISALAGVTLPQVHAAENSVTQLALIGCGGRGTGAAMNALSNWWPWRTCSRTGWMTAMGP
jgi:hypothetical protein